MNGISFDEWLPLDQAPEFDRSVEAFSEANDTTVTGSFAVEIYPAPANPFWISPGYQQDSVRFDLTWFVANRGNPATDFCPQFWELLIDMKFRQQWGKYIINGSGFFA